MQPASPSNLLRSEAELILQESRREKAEKTRCLGSPIELVGKVLDITICGNEAWIAENTSVVRKLDLESGKTLKLLRGHSAPVTSLALFDKQFGSGVGDILVSGSWDKTIKIWNTKNKKLISSTLAHADFVKTLLVIPSLRILVSSSSDKTVRFWDLSTYQDGQPLQSLGSISAHTRPVECISVGAISNLSACLYTADTMGIIKVWELTREGSTCRSTMIQDFNHHRTKVNEMVYGNDQLWTASSDDTVQVQYLPSSTPQSKEKKMPPITHPIAVKALLPLSLTLLAEPYLLTGAGDVIRAYDISSPDEPEVLSETDAHWHDVTALRLWMRTTLVEGTKGQYKVEPWIISTSLDGTLRKWRLSDLLSPSQAASPPVPKPNPPISDTYKMSEEEERELAELMDEE